MKRDLVQVRQGWKIETGSRPAWVFPSQHSHKTIIFQQCMSHMIKHMYFFFFLWNAIPVFSSAHRRVTAELDLAGPFSWFVDHFDVTVFLCCAETLCGSLSNVTRRSPGSPDGQRPASRMSTLWNVHWFLGVVPVETNQLMSFAYLLKRTNAGKKNQPNWTF